MRKFYHLVLLLGTFLYGISVQAICTQPIAQFPVNHSTLNFEGVLYDFPAFGQSTWFYKIDNTTGIKDISHISFKVSTCIDNSLFYKGGTYTSQSLQGLHYANDFVLGFDPSIPQHPYSVKYENEVKKRSTVYIFYVLKERLQIGTNLIYIKPGSNLESDSICGPSLSCTPIPVTLIEFTVALKQGYPNLEWSTASEKNNFGFFIEHCIDGHFHEEGFVESGHESDSLRRYSYIDKIHYWGYYRLRIEDYDGRAGYSPVVYLPKEGSTLQSLVYPTLVDDRITIFNKEMMIHSVALFNNAGQSMEVQKETNEHGEALNIRTSHLPTGLYYIWVNEREKFRFMKR